MEELKKKHVLFASGMDEPTAVIIADVSIMLAFATSTNGSYDTVSSWRHLDANNLGMVSYSPMYLNPNAELKGSGNKAKDDLSTYDESPSHVTIVGDKAQINGFECSADMLAPARLENSIRRAKSVVSTLQKISQDGGNLENVQEI